MKTATVLLLALATLPALAAPLAEKADGPRPERAPSPERARPNAAPAPSRAAPRQTPPLADGDWLSGRVHLQRARARVAERVASPYTLPL